MLEVVFSVGILLVALAAIPQLFLAAARANAESGDATWATVLAAQKLEELAARSAPEVTGGDVIEYLDQSGTPAVGATPRAFVRRWSVAPFAAAPDRTLVLSVAVSRYREGASSPRESARLLTLYTGTAP